MNSPAIVAAIRVLHIVAGTFWVGSAIFTAAFLLPSVRAVGPAAGPVMDQLVRVRKLPLWLSVAPPLTLVAGILLYGIDSGWFQSAWLASRPAMIYGFGALCAIAAAVIGGAVSGPTAQRMGAIGAQLEARGGPPTAEEGAEMSRLQARMGSAAVWQAVLLVVTTSAMAVARYVN